MKTPLARLNSSRRIGDSTRARRISLAAAALGFAAAMMLVPAAIPSYGLPQSATAQPAAQAAPDTSVECVLGLAHIKHHARGALTVGAGALHFTTEKGKAEIPISSIQDIFTARDSRQVFRGVGGAIVKAGVPYEGGRVLSLFSTRTEVLTVEYRDGDNGYHGAIFVLPKGQATVIKSELVEKGAKASLPPQAPGK